MKFKNFLNKKELVFTFGRMNPFTFGHYHLAQKLVDEAGSFHKPRIYLSHTTNPKKDPLSYIDKIEFAKKALIYYNIDVKKTKARTIIEVVKELEAEGFTDIALVVGSDRVREFKTLLDKYNGKEYNFNSIRIISAGERDPDAEGVEGMSASKVREFAANGDFEKFKKSVPFLPKTAKELYDKVRKGMGIKEDLDLDEEFEELLTEGVHDKGIFKAVFLAGGPGSGKDYVLSNTLDGQGLVEINSDKALEFLMDKKGLDKTMPSAEKASRDQVRSRAKDITELKQRLALKGRNGLIINGTGDDVEKITRIKKRLEELGYETSMMMVNTSDEVSAARNIERGQRGGRTVPETVRKEKWDAAQNARTEYAKMFGSNYMEFDNSEDLRSADPDTVKAKKMEMMELFKNVQDFIAKPPKNPKAEEWVAQELEKKDTYKVPQDGVEQIPPSGDQGASEAQKLGLKYYGFGRYGINGKVTHRSIHGKLVPVKKEEPKDKPKPKVKKESVDDEIQGLLSENFDLSDSSALNLLLLGTEIDEHDLPIGEEKEVKLLKDKAGRVRIFMLRAAAAREAHTSGGQVLKYKNGYVVQLKENHNVNEVNSKVFRTWYESRRNEASTRWSSASSNREVSTETRNYLNRTQ
jgi:nicotinic acid mononucleotide adenylyltransferase